MTAPDASAVERNYVRVAWWIISGAFVVFLVLMTGLCYAAWRFQAFAQSQPARPATLATYTRGVEILRAGLAQSELPGANAVLQEGDAVIVLDTVPPGVAATITVFDGSSIDLWAGTTVRLEQVQTTRFSSRNQRVAVLLEKGQARFKLVPPANRQYDDVQYTVAVQRVGLPLEQVDLDLGGTYRVRVLEATAPTVSESERMSLGATSATEYVAESGRAFLAVGPQQITLKGGEKVLNGAGGLSQPAPAVWQLIRDPQFVEFSDQEYNNTTVVSRTDLPRSNTWIVSGVPAPGATIDGFFYVSGGCFVASDAPETPCPRPLNKVAQFRRVDPPGHDKGFKTAVTQTLDLDTTSYQALQLNFDAHIAVQLLDKAGFIGEECALGVVIYYLSNEGNPENHTYCFYARDEPDGKGAISNKTYISSRFLALGDWHTINLDLKTDLPNMRQIITVELHGNGHDYLSEVANVHLVAR